MALKILLTGAAALLLAACGEASNTDSAAAATTAPETAAAQQEAGAVVSTAKSGAYAPDPNHRYITFSYLHQGYSRPWLRWRDWTGALNWDADAPENSSVSVTIDVSSIDSGVDIFDEHLVSAQHFDVANHPEITFVSTGVEVTGANTGQITGDLTIKGVTKSVTLETVFNKGDFNQERGVSKLGFSATTKINRSDYGLDYGVPVVSDEVDIMIETEWAMTAPANE